MALTGPRRRSATRCARRLCARLSPRDERQDGNRGARVAAGGLLGASEQDSVDRPEQGQLIALGEALDRLQPAQGLFTNQ